jgi:hypothetical protein
MAAAMAAVKNSKARADAVKDLADHVERRRLSSIAVPKRRSSRDERLPSKEQDGISKQQAALAAAGGGKKLWRQASHTALAANARSRSNRDLWQKSTRKITNVLALASLVGEAVEDARDLNRLDDAVSQMWMLKGGAEQATRE